MRIASFEQVLTPVRGATGEDRACHTHSTCNHSHWRAEHQCALLVLHTQLVLPSLPHSELHIHEGRARVSAAEQRPDVRRAMQR